MAVQDFGSGLLAGMQGAMAFAQQKRDNKFRQDELDLSIKKHEDTVEQWRRENSLKDREVTVAENIDSREQSKFNRQQVEQGNDRVIAAAQGLGIWKPKDALNVQSKET